MSLSPASFSGETSGANARAADPAALSQQELQLVASGDKVSGGRRRRGDGPAPGTKAGPYANRAIVTKPEAP